MEATLDALKELLSATEMSFFLFRVTFSDLVPKEVENIFQI
jgi:hypothetical protein